MLDAQLTYVDQSAPLSLIAAAGVSIASAVIDFLGVGVGVAPTSVIGNTTNFGAPDAMGVGGLRPELDIVIATALASATAGSVLDIQLQLAPDTGLAGGYQPGTWQTVADAPVPLAQGTANTRVARFPWLPPFPANLRPRFSRLLFTPVPPVTAPATPISFTAGTIGWAKVRVVREDPFNLYAVNNYKVA